MSRSNRLLLCGAAAASLALWGQEDAPLKARELFYKPLSATPAARPSAQRPAAKKAPAKKAPESPIEARVPSTSEARPDGGASVNLVKVNYSPQPLALKYTILKQTGDQYREVDPETEFHSGDHIRIGVEGNDSAYLYIVMQGSSGNWKVLFPDPAISGGDNRIERTKVYRIPPAELPGFYFNEQTGTEKVTLILTRKPEEDLEKLIYSAGERSRSSSDGKTMLAQNTAISSEVMGQVQHQMLSRDLVFEKTDGGGAGDKTEKAMYVATPDTSPGARVYVDLKLIHK